MSELLSNVKIERLVYGGNGLSRIDGRVTFIPFCIPGETLEIRIRRIKNKFAYGAIENIPEPSPYRVTPACKHFGRCGGCQWQHISYDGQLVFKQMVFEETLAKIGGGTGYNILPILPSPLSFGYRNRLRLQVKYGKVGFYAHESHDLIQIRDCAIAQPLINSILSEICAGLPECCLKLLNSMEVMATEEGQGLVILHTEKRSLLENEMCRISVPGKMPSVRNYYVQGCDRRDWPHITEQDSLQFTASTSAGAITYYIYPGIFSQVNLAQNNNLINKVLEWAALSANDTVLDLYCGMGNFTLPLAANAKEVIGIEVNSPSVRNALFNAAKNNIENIVLMNQPVSCGLDSLINSRKSFELVVIDPPRKGCREILSKLALIKCSKLLYISCDPATLARDMGILKSHGFIHTRSLPIDMFPQTYHIESLSMFSR